MSQSEKMNNDRSGQKIEPMYFGLLQKLKLRRKRRQAISRLRAAAIAQ